MAEYFANLDKKIKKIKKIKSFIIFNTIRLKEEYQMKMVDMYLQ